MTISWYLSRLRCWVVGHQVHAIQPSGRFPGENTHFCPRCLKFWRHRPSGLPLHIEIACVVFGVIEWLVIKIVEGVRR